jgi:hypothetical protein
MSTESLPLTSITLLESPEAQLAKAEAIRGRVLGQSDLPSTYHEYSKLAVLEEALKRYKGTSEAALFEVTLIRREAERKMGKMLLEIPRNPGARTDLTSSHGMTRLYEDVLKELELTRERANRWQHAARCPEDAFWGMVEQGRNGGLGCRPITLEQVVLRGRAQMQLDERKQAQEEATRRGKEEFLPKARVLARSVSSYSVFQSHLKEVIPEEGIDSRTKTAIRKVIKRYYPEEVESQRQEQQEQQKRDAEDLDKVYVLSHLKWWVTQLAKLHREGPSFRTLAGAVKSQAGKNSLDGYIADATDFSLEDAERALSYVQDVVEEDERALSYMQDVLADDKRALAYLEDVVNELKLAEGR